MHQPSKLSSYIFNDTILSNNIATSRAAEYNYYYAVSTITTILYNVMLVMFNNHYFMLAECFSFWLDDIVAPSKSLVVVVQEHANEPLRSLGTVPTKRNKVRYIRIVTKFTHVLSREKKKTTLKIVVCIYQIVFHSITIIQTCCYI